MAGTDPGPASRDVTVGIDVGGTKMLGVVLDAWGEVLVEAKVPTPKRRDRHGVASPPGPRQVLSSIESFARDLIAAAHEATSRGNRGSPGGAIDAGHVRVRAVGVGVPGLVDDRGVLRFAPNLLHGQGMELEGHLVEALGLRVVVDNDATCAAVGEWVHGAATGARDAVVVTLGTGIGGGLILDGAVRRGANGFLGEIGHMVVDPHGPPCPCGRRGCWERYASGAGLGRLAREAAAAGYLDSVVASVGGDPDAVRGELVTRAAAAGDAEAVAVVAEVGWWLALGLANLTSILDPGVIVVGGGLVEAGDLLLEPARRAFATMLEAGEAHPRVPIRPALLGERAGAVGAAVAARHGRRDEAGTEPESEMAAGTGALGGPDADRGRGR